MKNGFGRNLGFYVAGAIMGGVAVALTTPFTGRRMRRALRHKIEDCSGQVTETMRDLRHAGGQVWHRGERLARSAEKAFHRFPLRAAS